MDIEIRNDPADILFAERSRIKTDIPVPQPDGRPVLHCQGYISLDILRDMEQAANRCVFLSRRQPP